jgi:hypothetical protein
MRYFRPIRRFVQFVLPVVAACMIGQTTALAQASGSSSGEAGGGSWVWAYMIVLLAVTLGMIVVCKSSGRRDRAKPEVYAEVKPLPKE